VLVQAQTLGLVADAAAALALVQRNGAITRWEPGRLAATALS